MHERLSLSPPALPRSLMRVGVAASLLAAIALPAAAAAHSERPRGNGSGRSHNALLVNFRSGVDDAGASQALSAAGVTEIGRLDDLGTRVVDVPDSRRDASRNELASDPRVLSVEEDATAEAAVIPTDPHWYQAWGPQRVGAPAAWNVSTGRASTIIAIVDTGVDPKQPDLRGRVLPGWDFQNNDANPMDDNNHGTAVAGVAAAAANDGVGIAGMCWNCLILPVKVLNSHGSGNHSNIAAGVIWAVDHGADVINMSIAGPRETNVLANAVAYALSKGVVVVAAAGNEGSKRRFYPAAYNGVMSVGATNKKDQLYAWSNRGSYVKLAAPGCAVTGKPGPAWTRWCGTSFATPIIAGTAALIKSRRPHMARAADRAAVADQHRPRAWHRRWPDRGRACPSPRSRNIEWQSLADTDTDADTRQPDTQADSQANAHAQPNAGAVERDSCLARPARRGTAPPRAHLPPVRPRRPST